MLFKMQPSPLPMLPSTLRAVFPAPLITSNELSGAGTQAQPSPDPSSTRHLRRVPVTVPPPCLLPTPTP